MATCGHCLCRQTGWVFEDKAAWACYCHCDNCRRNCSAPVVAFLGVPLKNFQWTGTTPKIYESSAGVCRHFCGNCGSPMGFEAKHYAGEIYLYAASLDNPRDFNPTFHVNYASKLPWLDIHDDLTKYGGTLLESSKELK